MPKKIIAILIALALVGAGLAAQGTVAVSLTPGAAYIHKVRLGLFPMSMPPQMAIWIEAADGRYVDTIYVTDKAAAGKWRAAGRSLRPESLPVWAHARAVAGRDGSFMPDKAHPLPDAVSGATEKAAFQRIWQVPAGFEPGTYRVRVELNSSFDWNEAYPDKLAKTDPRWSEVNGQPSIVWETSLQIGDQAVAAELAPIGTGALRGEDGAVRLGLDGITTAKDIAASIEAAYRP